MIKQKNELEIHGDFRYYMNKTLLNITKDSRKQQIICFVLRKGSKGNI
jgi:ketosteroid isomerase-like protein